MFYIELITSTYFELISYFELITSTHFELICFFELLTSTNFELISNNKKMECKHKHFINTRPNKFNSIHIILIITLNFFKSF